MKSILLALRLLDIGDYKATEIEARHGEEVLALFCHQTCVVRPVTLSVEPVMGIDDLPGEKSGKRVDINDLAEDLVMLFRDIPEIPIGMVPPAPSAFTLRRTATPVGDGFRVDLVLTTGGVSQRVASVRSADPDVPVWTVLSASDLDRDGRLDLVLGADDGHDSELTLLLSSAAAPGRAVGVRGKLFRGGC